VVIIVTQAGAQPVNTAVSAERHKINIFNKKYKIKKNIMAKTPKIREERPPTVIKAIVNPLSTDLKIKISTAFQAVVTAIKDKHLS